MFFKFNNFVINIADLTLAYVEADTLYIYFSTGNFIKVTCPEDMDPEDYFIDFCDQLQNFVENGAGFISDKEEPDSHSLN